MNAFIQNSDRKQGIVVMLFLCETMPNRLQNSKMQNYKREVGLE